VLEIALIRLARPELDASPAALLERLERLERAVASAPPAQAAASAPASAAARPSLGQLRRTGSTRPAAEPTEVPSASIDDGGADASGTGEPATQPGGSPEAAEAPPSAAAAHDAAPGGASLDRDTLTIAWGDEILSKLSPRARALYQPGRFTEASAGGCTFAVPNEAHRAQCEKKRAEVEGVLAAHFGFPVHLSLIVDRPAAQPPEDRAAGPSPDVADLVDLDDLDGGVAGDTASIATARVLDAFPGATEVST
jgi:hypothetical protein